MADNKPIPQGTLSNLLKESWDFFTKYFKMIMLITLVISVPVHLVSSIFDVQTEVISTDSGVWESVSTNIFGAQGLVVILLVSLAGLLIPVALAIFIKKAKGGKVLDLSGALQAAFARWPSAIITTLIGGALLIGLFLLLVVPGILFGVWWFFAIYAVALSGKSGMAALRYSKDLVTGRWWTIFGYLLTFGILTGVIASLLTWPIPASTNSYLASVVIGIISDLVTSFFVVASVLLFLQLEKGIKSSSSTAQK